MCELVGVGNVCVWVYVNICVCVYVGRTMYDVHCTSYTVREYACVYMRAIVCAYVYVSLHVFVCV